MSKIAVIHGPNLNLLGTRETDIYGQITLEEINRKLAEAAGAGHELRSFQSNHEGELVDYIHAARVGRRNSAQRRRVHALFLRLA